MGCPCHWLTNTDGLPRWLQLLGLVATVAAAWFAVAAITESRKQSAKNADAIVRERRIDFELDQLQKLLELTAGNQYGGSRSTQTYALAQLFEPPRLPRLRAALRLETTEDGKQWLASVSADNDPRRPLEKQPGHIQDELLAEIKALVARRSDADS